MYKTHICRKKYFKMRFWYRLIPLLSVPSDLNSGNHGILNEDRFTVVTPLKLAGRKN